MLRFSPAKIGETMLTCDELCITVWKAAENNTMHPIGRIHR